MAGWELFYPMGWDDNGLPTERRVQNYFGVRCDPSLPYDPAFVPPAEPSQAPISVSRPNFIELCHRLTADDEQVFEALWRKLGLSVDWTQTYATIDDRARRASQRAFLRNLARGEAYAAEAPTLWDVDFQTAVAQAELDDRELAGAFHRLRFDDVEIETTRPELLPACVAVVAHPDDARYRPRFGTTVHTPLFHVEVPVVAHELADPEKGTGIAMICTFGDVTDVVWWRELQLPIRSVVARTGRITNDPPPGVPGDGAWRELAGTTVKQARQRIVEMLRVEGALVGEPRPVTHLVKFFEKGDRPLEIVTSRQWYIRNGGRDEPLRAEMRELGAELRWHPPSMATRYTNWVDGLNGDWLISRQRYFGVPFPIWYPIDDAGEIVHDQPLLPSEDRLPLDPTTDVPDGYREEQRGEPGGFAGDPDVMDTWATSSMTPQIVCGWEDDGDLFARTFPMDLRPQGPEIIRTWLFATALRSRLEHGHLPWTDATINGWILDPERKKMSKSRGNVVTPMPLIDEYGADAVRYWACNGRPGTDTALDHGVMKIGRRLAIKILNASKFVLGIAGDGADPPADGPIDGAEIVTEPLDGALLLRLAEVVDAATAAFENHDYARALDHTETFFWTFCDDYVELVKARAYGGRDDAAARSAQRSLTTALSVLQRLFAPALPFVSEEVWSWWRDGSIHTAAWPAAAELRVLAPTADASTLDAASAVIGDVRAAKSQAQRSMRWAVEHLVVCGPADHLARVQSIEPDLRAAGNIATIAYEATADPDVKVTLAPA
jgi:valyl-tRNA synthetase